MLLTPFTFFCYMTVIIFVNTFLFYIFFWDNMQCNNQDQQQSIIKNSLQAAHLFSVLLYDCYFLCFLHYYLLISILWEHSLIIRNSRRILLNISFMLFSLFLFCVTTLLYDCYFLCLYVHYFYILSWNIIKMNSRRMLLIVFFMLLLSLFIHYVLYSLYIFFGQWCDNREQLENLSIFLISYT